VQAAAESASAAAIRIEYRIGLQSSGSVDNEGRAAGYGAPSVLTRTREARQSSPAPAVVSGIAPEDIAVQ
jgi:hypothetical protein